MLVSAKQLNRSTVPGYFHIGRAGPQGALQSDREDEMDYSAAGTRENTPE